MNRRSLFKGTAATTVMLVAENNLFASLAQPAEAQSVVTSIGSAPFTLPALPYSYDALEPFIDAETMHLHHDKHHASYVDKLNAAVTADPSLAHRSLVNLLTGLNSLPEASRAAVRNQGGGHANHTFWWSILSKTGPRQPKGELATDIDKQFGSLSGFQEQLTKSAIGVFGSGWAWLNLDQQGILHIETTPNQDSPITAGKTPILGIDVWEHAYYLKYQNRRPEYVSAFFNVLNWDYISGEYAKAKNCCKVQQGPSPS